MVVNDICALLNALICSLIVITLMFYQRQDARHRPAISVLAYLIVLTWASVPLRFLFGLHTSPHWPIVAGNLIFCALLLRHKGNLARLVDFLRQK
jgi:hypothetical protein